MEDDQNQEANLPAEHAAGSSEVSSDDTTLPQGAGGRRAAAPASPSPAASSSVLASSVAPAPAQVKGLDKGSEPKADKPERAEKLERADKADRSDRSDKADKVEKTEKAERVEKKRSKTTEGGKPNMVRRIRIERMMSKAELARSANLSVLTIDRVEKGFGCRVDTKRKILEALGLSLADRVRVFGEEE